MLEIGLWLVGAILARQDQRENIARVETQYYMQRVWSIIPGEGREVILWRRFGALARP